MEPDGIRQTLTNLVVNAFEAGSSEVVLRIKLAHASLSIEVIDNGPGLPEKIDLFKPFVTTKPNGTGLGLAQVKSFVDRNDGSLHVKSNGGQGTTFTLEFSRQFVLNEGV